MLPGEWPPCRGAPRRHCIYTHCRPGPGCRGPVKGASSDPRLQVPTQRAPPGCGLWLWGDLGPGLLRLGCGSSASVSSAGRALPRTSQPVLLPLVRFGESRTDQAHGEREGPRPPHSYTRVFPQLPRAFGGGPPALPGTAREHLGGPVGPEEGQAAGLHGPRRAPSPPGVAKPPCSPLGPPPRAFWVPTWRPRADPWRLPTAGTKPEPAAQREGVPHQGAADPGGLPAPRQAAADELDRRPR